MSQENQTMNSAPVGNMPVKRKRGRPRKNENLIRADKPSATPVTDAVRRKQSRKVAPEAPTHDPMVGQVVSGVLDGSFDAGYLLTVRVGNTNKVLRGIVFEPHLTVPISGANDVAPQVKMLNRIQVSLEKPAQVHGSANQFEQKRRSRNEGSVPTKAPSLVNHVPQASPPALQKVETTTENQIGQVSSQPTETPMKKRKATEVSPKDEPLLLAETTKSETVSTHLVAELSLMLQDNQTARNSDTPVDIRNKSTSEVPRKDETLCVNGKPGEMSGPIQITEIDGLAAEPAVLPKSASETQMPDSSVISNNKDIVGVDSVSLVQSYSDLFGNTDSFG